MVYVQYLVNIYKFDKFQLRWLDADVVCLQEVDPSYFPHLVKELATCGYEGMLQAHSRPCDDGVATFFKTDKFQLKDYEVFGFNEMLGEVIQLDQFENRNDHNERQGQYTVLQDLKSGNEIVVGREWCNLIEILKDIGNKKIICLIQKNS